MENLEIFLISLTKRWSLWVITCKSSFLNLFFKLAILDNDNFLFRISLRKKVYLGFGIVLFRHLSRKFRGWSLCKIGWSLTILLDLKGNILQMLLMVWIHFYLHLKTSRSSFINIIFIIHLALWVNEMGNLMINLTHLLAAWTCWGILLWIVRNLFNLRTYCSRLGNHLRILIITKLII